MTALGYTAQDEAALYAMIPIYADDQAVKIVIRQALDCGAAPADIATIIQESITADEVYYGIEQFAGDACELKDNLARRRWYVAGAAVATALVGALLYWRFGQ